VLRRDPRHGHAPGDRPDRPAHAGDRRRPRSGHAPADAEVLAARIAGSQLVTLDAAHLSNIEQSAAFNAALLDFLS
jgi:pimeloyl-ACP methyl ester carboxylesterase